MFRVPNGQNHPAAFGELSEKGLWNRRSSSRDENGVERRKFRQAQRAVAAVNMHVAITEPRELFGSRGGKLRPPLDREYFLGQA